MQLTFETDIICEKAFDECKTIFDEFGFKYEKYLDNYEVILPSQDWKAIKKLIRYDAEIIIWLNADDVKFSILHEFKLYNKNSGNFTSIKDISKSDKDIFMDVVKDEKLDTSYYYSENLAKIQKSLDSLKDLYGSDDDE